ncbi:alpha/beta fold hydrolase [Actinoalloteichus hymeniacidonis]|uniref:Hydrolase or acyltransferase of alpha/beta superfamily n=1 Tax=Actinoalloteichus hymeniacidonis TaxID=340345 RepID=A0AAC9HRL1_9PSEU|nr:alpha/beta hydrolase [Actinoalloteichus hymeniacidonis]AOS63956.1 putative hydrolase or acyltransferase of alpha/beta superfamily [Actinoalloteichus hymeniacidonis]MBB5907987.1 pimeloyl-ACP methyl ester carboxylesterase [Actinoalloteichus hymeniacidonis]
MHIEHVRGTGTPVVLLHGGGVAGWMWRPLRQHLPSTLELIVPDLPGHDGSASEPFVSRDHTAAELLRYLESEVDRPFAVVGFSFGAQLAVQLAAIAPDRVSHAVVISAQAKPTRLPKLTIGLLSAAAPLAKNPKFARAQAKELFIPEELIDDYLQTSTQLTTSTLTKVVDDNIRFTIPPAWSDYPGSALVLAGQKERGVMKESAQRLQQALPAGELEIVEGCGHGIPLQRPEWLAKRIGTLLGEGR